MRLGRIPDGQCRILTRACLIGEPVVNVELQRYRGDGRPCQLVAMAGEIAAQKRRSRRRSDGGHDSTLYRTGLDHGRHAVRRERLSHHLRSERGLAAGRCLGGIHDLTLASATGGLSYVPSKEKCRDLEQYLGRVFKWAAHSWTQGRLCWGVVGLSENLGTTLFNALSTAVMAGRRNVPCTMATKMRRTIMG